MNVELPFQHSINAFIIVIITAIFLSILGVVFFVKKKWL
jgi:Mg2+ and Co2+ transporter CorA